MKSKYILMIGLILCSIGMASAADNSTDLELFSAADTAKAKEVITNSGAGNIFALISLIVGIAVWVSPVILLVIAITALSFGKHDTYKFAIKGFVLMAVVLLLYNLYMAMIGSLTPDFSSIAI